MNKDIQKLVNDTPKLAENIRRKLGHRTKQLAKGYVVPRFNSTGNLKSSIILRKEGIDSTLIIAEAPYSDFVELGTKPHIQEFPLGSKGDMLAQFWRGNTLGRDNPLRKTGGSSPALNKFTFSRAGKLKYEGDNRIGVFDKTGRRLGTQAPSTEDLMIAHQHPGAKPMGFMQQAFAQINKEMEGIILKETNKYVERRT